MTLKIDGVEFDQLTADPSTPVDGEQWFNVTEGRAKYKRGGSIKTVGDKEDLDTHEADGGNPHTTTLEQARSENNAVSGQIDMGTNKIVNAGSGSAAGDVATIQNVDDKITQRIVGLDWQDSVLDKDLVTSPGSPGAGDRYIIAGIGGAWSGFTINDVVEFDGSVWTNSVPNEGFTARVEDEDRNYQFSGTSWVFFGTTIDHGNLIGNGDDDHTQYHRTDGARAMTGALDMGTNAITNVGLVDGVDVGDHKARHIRGGADEMDGDVLDIDYVPANYTRDVSAPQVTNVEELTAHLKGLDVALLAAGGGLATKAGKVLNAAFTGNPKKATVTFAGAFADANYSPSVISESTGSSFAPTVESITASSFVINLQANNITGLVAARWTAIEEGET